MKTPRHPRFTFGALAVLLASFALAGCNDHIDIKDPTDPPIASRVSTDAIEINVGIAVGFTAVARHGNDEISKDRVVELQSDNPLVAGASPTVHEREFVVYGVGKGTANVLVLFDGEEVERIPVTVNEQ